MRLIIEARLEGNDIEPTVVPIPLGRVNSHGFARSQLRWLCERAREWPPAYVRDCWPELLGSENRLMLHRRKITSI